jgi:hypothetical protein
MSKDPTLADGTKALPCDTAELAEENVITMDKRVDLAVMLAIVVLGVLMVVGAADIRHGVIPDPVGSRGLPVATGIFLVVGGLVLAAMRLRTWRELPGNFVVEEGKADNPEYPATWMKPFSIAALGFLWVWTLEPFGYLIVTPPFLIGTVLIMQERSFWKVIAFPVLFTFVSWYCFSQLLAIILPLGPLTSLARSYGLTP